MSKGLVKNSGIVVFGVIVSNIFAYIFHIYVGRTLGPEEYGIFGSVMALFMILALPAGSIGLAMTKFTSFFYSKKDYGTIQYIRQHITRTFLFYSIIFCFALIILSKEIASFLQITAAGPIIIVGVMFIFAILLPIHRGLLQGMKRFSVYSINSVFESVTRLVLVIVFLWFGFGIDGSLLAYGLGYLCAYVAIFPFIRNVTHAKEKHEAISMRQLYQFIGLVFLVTILIQGIINVPTIFIKHYFSSTFTGYWTAALTLARITLFVVTGISLVMFSEVSGQTNNHKQRKLFLSALGLVLFAGSIIALFFWFIPELFIGLLYGPAFIDGASQILQWMSIAMIGIGCLQLWANYKLAVMNVGG